MDEIQAAAIAVASLNKVILDQDPRDSRKRAYDEVSEVQHEKKQIKTSREDNTKEMKVKKYTESAKKRAEEDEGEESRGFTPPFEFIEFKIATLAPYPFFYYEDHSQVPDEDPLLALTPPGRVPNFPAKMYAILSDPELEDVISWMPHGRSWRVLKPREFEIQVIPKFFEHSKFCSFIRQANGWGFRRITQGPDRYSYYHELFLRGLPHLCKKMKRPGVAEKASILSKHEPDLCKISELHPLPERPCEDESIKYQVSTLRGPKERMPVNFGVFNATKLYLKPSKETLSMNGSEPIKGATAVVTAPCTDVSTPVSSSSSNTVYELQSTFFEHHGEASPLFHPSVAAQKVLARSGLNAYLSREISSEDNARFGFGASLPMNNMIIAPVQNYGINSQIFGDESSCAAIAASNHLNAAASRIRYALNKALSQGSPKCVYNANQA